MVNEEDIRRVLQDVYDPEIPSLSILDMGIVRRTEYSNNTARVTISPTYSGCPAMKMIEDEIRAALQKAGYGNVEIITSFTEAWSSEWITETGRQRMMEANITPPQHMSQQLLQIEIPERNIPCSFCHSTDTKLISRFGSTACKSYYTCNSCQTAFEYFKPI